MNDDVEEADNFGVDDTDDADDDDNNDDDDVDG